MRTGGYISEPSQLHGVRTGEPGLGRFRTGLITAGCFIQTGSSNRQVVVKTRIPKILTPWGGKKEGGLGGGGTKGGKERERERERKSIWGAFVAFVTLALRCLALLSSSPFVWLNTFFGSKGIYVPLFSSVMSMCCCCPLQTPAAALPPSLPPCLPACLPATLVF